MMQDWLSHWNSSDYLLLNWVALTLLILSAFMTISMRDLLGSAVVLAIFSLMMALSYLMLDAPDVALTEAAVGAGITTVLFLGTLSFTRQKPKVAPLKRRVQAFAVVSMVGLALIYASADLPEFGARDATIHQHVAPYYLEHTATDIDIDNYVTAILGSYRGFDTMGEVAVVFTAGVSIIALLMNLPQIRPTVPAQPASPAQNAPTTPIPPQAATINQQATSRTATSQTGTSQTGTSQTGGPSSGTPAPRSPSPANSPRSRRRPSLLLRRFHRKRNLIKNKKNNGGEA